MICQICGFEELSHRGAYCPQCGNRELPRPPKAQGKAPDIQPKGQLETEHTLPDPFTGDDVLSEFDEMDDLLKSPELPQLSPLEEDLELNGPTQRLIPNAYKKKLSTLESEAKPSYQSQQVALELPRVEYQNFQTIDETSDGLAPIDFELDFDLDPASSNLALDIPSLPKTNQLIDLKTPPPAPISLTKPSSSEVILQVDSIGAPLSSSPPSLTPPIQEHFPSSTQTEVLPHLHKSSPPSSSKVIVSLSAICLGLCTYIALNTFFPITPPPHFQSSSSVPTESLSKMQHLIIDSAPPSSSPSSIPNSLRADSLSSTVLPSSTSSKESTLILPKQSASQRIKSKTKNRLPRTYKTKKITKARKTSKAKRNRVIASSSTSYEALMKEGQRYIRRSSLGVAEARFKQAARLRPKSPDPLAQLGWCQIDRKRITKAKQYFKQALALNGKHGDSLYGLGYAYTVNREWKSARSFFNRYLTLYPQGSKVKIIQNKLRNFPN